MKPRRKKEKTVQQTCERCHRVWKKKATNKAKICPECRLRQAFF